MPNKVNVTTTDASPNSKVTTLLAVLTNGSGDELLSLRD
jgi:hypothetical protein